MSLIHIKLDYVKGKIGSTQRLNSMIRDVYFGTNNTRMNLDPEIIKRRNVATRLFQLNRSLSELETDFHRLQAFIYDSIGKYESKENILNRKADSLKDEGKNDWLKMGRAELLGFTSAMMDTNKWLKYKDGLRFEMYRKDGKIYFRAKGEKGSYKTNRDRLREQFGGSNKDWKKGYINRMYNDGIPLYNKAVDGGGFIENRRRFSNTPFDDLNNHVNNLGEGKTTVAYRTGKQTFVDNIKVWDDFKGWKGATHLNNSGKALGILGTGLTLFDNYKEFQSDPSKDRLTNFTVNTAVDITTGAASMAAGAAIGSVFLPPLGTVVGAAAGIGINFLINTKVGGPPAESVVDRTKNIAKSAVKESKKLIGNVGKKLDKIFW